MRHVLVVEDEPDFAELLKYAMERCGFRVTVVHKGAAAIMAARTFYPDLILLDLGLPDMSGNEVCRTIKHSYDVLLRQIPIIMVTGRDQDADRVVGTVMGAVYYISKPANLSDLMEKVEHLLAA